MWKSASTITGKIFSTCVLSKVSKGRREGCVQTQSLWLSWHFLRDGRGKQYHSKLQNPDKKCNLENMHSLSHLLRHYFSNLITITLLILIKITIVICNFLTSSGALYLGISKN